MSAVCGVPAKGEGMSSTFVVMNPIPALTVRTLFELNGFPGVKREASDPEYRVMRLPPADQRQMAVMKRWDGEREAGDARLDSEGSGARCERTVGVGKEHELFRRRGGFSGVSSAG